MANIERLLGEWFHERSTAIEVLTKHEDISTDGNTRLRCHHFAGDGREGTLPSRN